jgi:hypothetical protein
MQRKTDGEDERNGRSKQQRKRQDRRSRKQKKERTTHDSHRDERNKKAASESQVETGNGPDFAVCLYCVIRVRLFVLSLTD